MKIINYSQKHRGLIYAVLALPVVVGMIYQLIYRFLYPLPYLSWSRFQLLVGPFIELLLLFTSFDIYLHYKKEKPAIIWLLVFFITIVNLIAVFAFTAYYEERSVYSHVQAFLLFASFLKGILIVGLFFCLGMIFKKPLIWAWNTYSFADYEEKSQKGAWLTVVILLVCFIVGLGLRLYNLGNFPPYVDEYTHMRTAVAIIKGQPVEYTRAFVIVTLPVYLSYRLLGIGVWTARLPMVLLNMLAIFPLYFLGRKINKGVGYISIILFVISPWIIAVSRTVREYAVVPLFFYIAAILLIDLLDWDNLNLKDYLRRHIYRLLLAGLILGYAFYDGQSIFKVIIALYGIFGFLAVLKMLNSNSSRRQKITILCLGGIGLFLLIAYTELVRYYPANNVTNYTVALTYWNSLVKSSVRQWYIIKEIGYLILLVGSLFAIRSVISRYTKNEFALLFCFVVFTANFLYLTFFLVHAKVTEHPRYGVLMEYWYLLVVAIVLYAGYCLLKSIMKRGYLAVFIVLSTILFLNYPAIRMDLSYQGGGALEITGEHHYLVESAYDYLVGQLTKEDVLDTDILQSYDTISGNHFSAQQVIHYRSIDPLTVIEQYPQGWIAVTLNAHPENTDLQFSDFEYAGKHIRYLGLMGDVYLWQWGK
jgi:hypothetical protein